MTRSLPARTDATPNKLDEKFRRAGWRLDPHICPTCQAAPAKEPSMTAKPSRAAMVAQAKTIQLLGEHFDTERGQFADGWSDVRIAKETGAAPELVTEYRIAAFGEIKEPSELAALRADIASIEALQREQSASIAAEIAALRSRLGAVSARFAA